MKRAYVVFGIVIVVGLVAWYVLVRPVRAQAALDAHTRVGIDRARLGLRGHL